MHRPGRVFAAAIVITLSVVTLAAAVASGQTPTTQAPDPGVGVRLLEAPEARRDDPRARRFIIDHLAPGTSISRRIEVSNGTDREVTIPVFPVAATLRDDAFVPGGARETNDLTSWITVTPAEVTLAPGARATAEIVVRVPKDADAGERYAVVVAELPPPPDQAPGIVAVYSRAGIRLYISVGAGAEPPTSFRLVTFEPTLRADGTPAVVIDTCNSGGRAIDLNGSLELTDGPGGTSAGPFAAEDVTTLAPSQCGTVAIRLRPDIPRGPWKATVTLRSGTKEQQATATITFPDQPGTAAPAVKAKPKDVTGTSGGRWALLIALLLLLLVLLLLLWWLWRRRKKQKEESAEPTPSARGEQEARS